MKKLYLTLLILGAVLLTLSNASADSDIKGAVINVPGKINQAVNVAVGKNVDATQSSIKLKHLDMGGAVVNTN